MAGVQAAYGQLWGVVQLPAVRRLAVLLLVLRLGMLPAESAAPLKLLERGVSKEALAGMVIPSACLHEQLADQQPTRWMLRLGMLLADSACP